MVKLRELVPQGIEFYHLIDKYAAGDKDEDWIPKLRVEGGWVVITADAGKNSKVGQKLPDLCVIHQVTHIILKGQFHHKTTLEKSDLIATACKARSRPPTAVDTSSGSDPRRATSRLAHPSNSAK